MKVLRINSKQVTDGGIPHLLRLSKLEGLYIDAAQITDDGLKELVKLLKLDYLLLANTRVNKKTAEEIESKRNGLTIVVH